MTIPNYQNIMLPLLRLASDGKEHSIRNAIEKLASDFHLTNEERRRLLGSGKQEVFDNRVGWAKTYLKKAGLLDITRWGYFKITERGLKLLEQNPKYINVELLYKYAEFKEFKALKHKTEKKTGKLEAEEGTPEEELEKAYENVRNNLAGELIQYLRNTSPVLFEHIVLDLLVRMGYGGSLKDAAEAVGGIGDEGIDGIIKEDKLGLEAIYIQAKRWQGTVGRPEIQKFAGALAGHHAKKGIFISTSDYTREAREYAKLIENKIVLIDGNELAQLMIDYNVGVAPINTFEVKRIDSDYFTST